MNQWADRMRNHAVFNELQGIDKVLEDIKEKCLQDAERIEDWDRANAVVAHVRTVLDQADPLLVVPVNLNNLTSYLQQAKNEINNFASNNNPGHWASVHTHLDNCLAQLAALPRQSASGIEDMRDVAASYRSAVSGWMEAIKRDGEGISQMQAALQSRITEATTEIGAQKQRLDNAIATFQQQFSDAQQSRQTEFSASEQARTQAASASEQTRQTEFNESENKRVDSAAKGLERAAENHKELVAKLDGDSRTIIDAMEKLKTHAQKVVGIISDTGMAHGYQATANTERTEAGVWKKVAAWSLVVWILIGLVFFALTYDKDLTWAAVARQFLISTPFVLLAGFAAMQVSRHQKNERGLRQAELEIASLDPFLATLDDKERNAVKKEFATRYFGQREIEPARENADSKLIDLSASLAKTLLDIQQAIKK